jgi:phage-related minor tail protein
MAKNQIKGINIEIGGDTKPLDKALGDVNVKTSRLQTELKEVEKLLKLDPTNTELLSQKQKLLGDSIANTGDKLKALKDAEIQVQEQFKKGEVSEEQYRNLQREIIKTEQDLKKVEDQAKKTNTALTPDQAIGNLKNMGKAAGVAAIGIGAAAVGMGVAAVNNADNLQKLSTKQD